MNVAGEFNSGIPFPLFFQRFDITAGMGMIASSDDELSVGNLLGDDVEGIDHHFQAFISPPFAEGENSMFGIAASRKVRRLRSLRQDAVRSHMHVVAAIFFRQNFAIPRHEHRHGIRQQQNSRGHRARPTISSREANSRVLQIDGIHQVMQRDMGVAAIQPCEKRRHQSKESNQRIAPERAEQQIEPDDIRLQFADRLNDAAHTAGIIE